MKKNGFTLIEIIAVIAILLLFTVIAVPSINNMINKNEEKNMKNVKQSIYDAYDSYCNFNECHNPIEFSELINEGLLDEDDLLEYYNNIDNCTINNNYEIAYCIEK